VALTRVSTKHLPTGSIWFPTAVRRRRWSIPGEALLPRVLVSFSGVDLGLNKGKQGETRGGGGV
jgi:hypothetical protein